MAGAEFWLFYYGQIVIKNSAIQKKFHLAYFKYLLNIGINVFY